MLKELESIAREIPQLILDEVSNIPIIITEEHQQVFPFWDFLQDATLVHIDSHSDLADKSPIRISLSEYHRKLKIGNFICPAVHYGIINEIFWISPFCKDSFEDKSIQYFDRDKLRTELSLTGIIWNNSEFSEKLEGGGLSYFGDEYYIGKILDAKTFEKQIKKKDTILLDIDLDAFAKKIYG